MHAIGAGHFLTSIFIKRDNFNIEKIASMKMNIAQYE